METKWNKLLARQIKRHFGGTDSIPETITSFLQDINITYNNFDDDTKLLQNSIEISSQELRDAITKQKCDALIQSETLAKIKEAIYALNPSEQMGAPLKNNPRSESSHLVNSLIRLIEERNMAEEQLKQKTEEIESQNEELNQSNAQLVAAKIQAEESERLKSAFLANMSHEIKTPINGILGFAHLLKEPGLDADQQSEFIGIIEKNGDRMLQILGDIICISKVESGQMELSLAETNIVTQIDYIFDYFKKEVEEKRLGFILKKGISEDELILRTDREKVSVILINLVNNAIKFTQKGSIEIGYRVAGPNIEFHVKDTGVGIRPDQKEFIFERFRQGSESLSRNYEGAGLGLSISKAYVEMLGGRIWVESEESAGTTFYFTLPREV